MVPPGRIGHRMAGTWTPIDAAGFDTFSVAQDGVGWAAG
jgi:hypothetical protein